MNLESENWIAGNWQSIPLVILLKWQAIGWRGYKKEKWLVGLFNNKVNTLVTLSCFNYCYSIVIGNLYDYSYCEADAPVDNRHISSCKTIPSKQHLCHRCITLMIPIECQIADERTLSAYMYQCRTIIYIIRQYLLFPKAMIQQLFVVH